MPFLRFGDVIAEMPNVDDLDVLERLGSSTALRIALEMLRPRNWWGAGFDAELLFAIARGEGIPVVWVPDQAVLAHLIAVEKAQRLEALVNYGSRIIEDCQTCLSECTDPWLADQLPLALAAVHAYRAHHHEAAMALAVSVTEPLAIWSSTPRVQAFGSAGDRLAWQTRRRKGGKYRWAAQELEEKGLDLYQSRYRYLVLIAPVPRFFTGWLPGGKEPLPTGFRGTSLLIRRRSVSSLPRIPCWR